MLLCIQEMLDGRLHEGKSCTPQLIEIAYGSPQGLRHTCLPTSLAVCCRTFGSASPACRAQVAGWTGVGGEVWAPGPAAVLLGTFGFLRFPLSSSETCVYSIDSKRRAQFTGRVANTWRDLEAARQGTFKNRLYRQVAACRLLPADLAGYAQPPNLRLSWSPDWRRTSCLVRRQRRPS